MDFETDKIEYQDEYQINGSASHEKTDSAEYSSKKSILQGISVYSEKYGLFGKIDSFDTEKGILTERKKKIKTIYDGYVFQLFAQYFALIEMGYVVNTIRLYSMDDNKIYVVKKPEEDPEMMDRFENTIESIKSFSMDKYVQTNKSKCQYCIYEPLCSYSLLKEEGDIDDDKT